MLLSEKLTKRSKALIEFNEDRHEYSLRGLRLPSVTQVISSLGISDYSSCLPSVLENAMRYGKYLHKATDLSDRKILDITSIDPGIMQDLSAWEKFKKDEEIEILASELKVHSAKYYYCGTIDKVVLWKGIVAIFDLKTTVELSASNHMQLDGYFTAFNEEYKPRATKKYIIHLKDGECRPIDSNDPIHRGIFTTAINLYSWNLINKVKISRS